MTIRPYEASRDLESARRIWNECGWLSDSGNNEFVDVFLKLERSMVAEVDGSAECLVITTPGTMVYLDDDVPCEHVSCVTTSFVGRKKGLAGRVTAQTMALDAQDGAAVSVLGMFEQGFYDRLGFGSGTYENFTHFDPSRLILPDWYQYRTPVRLTTDDAEEMQALRCRRHRCHGQCSMPHIAGMETKLFDDKKAIGLGYRDDSGALTHAVWLRRTDDPEHGPYRVSFYLFETVEQFVELLGILRSIGDQVYSIRSYEPPMIRIQDFIRQPWRARQTTRGGPFDQQTWSVCWWQARILNLEMCLSKTRLPGNASVKFNLSLTDPIDAFLVDAPVEWNGVAGDYVVELGPSSGCERGVDASLPTMRTSVNAFTRLWLGVHPPATIAAIDGVDAPESLIEELSSVLRLPLPHPDWDL